MKSPPFGYVRARDTPDVFRLRTGAGPESRLLAGGQSLLPTLAFRLSDPGTLIDITRVEALRGIRHVSDGALRVGALTTHAELGRDASVRAHVPVLADAVALIAHPAIRNRGTIGGSLAYADPAAELPAVCVALDAIVIAVGPAGERRIAARDFFPGLFTTALAEDELIAAIEFPAMRGRRATIHELARRSGDYAMAGVVLAAGPGAPLLDPRLVFFGVGDRPIIATGAAARLAAGGADVLAAAQTALDHDLDPPSDQHGGPAFKRQLARVLLARAVASLTDRGGAR